MTSRDAAGEGAGPTGGRRLHSRRDMLRYGAVGTGVVAGGPLLAACSSSATPTTTSTTTTTTPISNKPKSGGTLSFARDTGPTQLDPANSIVDGDVYTLDKIFEPLYITNAAGVLTPWLAQGHTVSNDGKSWTFSLRPGVKFSDGKPVTASDVVFSIHRAATATKGPLSFLDFAIKTMKATDSSTVSIELSQPWVPFLSDISAFANSILPANLGGLSETAFFADPIGTGPFVLKSFHKGSGAVLRKNRNYWQPGKPYLDEVSFTSVPNDKQRVLELTSGGVDVISRVPPAQVRSLEKNASVVLKAFGSWDVDMLFFNEKVPQFKDRNVRRAINYAIDIPALANASTFGTAAPGNSFFPPSLEYYAHVQTLTFNLAKAKAELAKSKYRRGFSFSILVPSSNSQYVKAATIIQRGLKPLNIKVSVQKLDNAAYTAAFESFKYQAMINGATTDISDPDEMASFEIDVQDGGSHSFWTYYDNPTAIALVRRAQITFNNTQRAALYREIQAIVAQDAPFIALDYPPNIYAWLPKVHGLAVNPRGAYRLEDVWLS